MAIIRVQFVGPVANVGESWSRDKNGKTSTLTEKGAWLLVTFTAGGANKGQRVRVPMHNVVSITEDDVVEAVK